MPKSHVDNKYYIFVQLAMLLAVITGVETRHGLPAVREGPDCHGAGRALRGEIHVRDFLFHASAVGQAVLYHSIFHRPHPGDRHGLGAAHDFRQRSGQTADTSISTLRSQRKPCSSPDPFRAF